MFSSVRAVFFLSSCFLVLPLSSVSFAGLDDYTIYARNAMTLNDRARISGDGSTGIGSGGALTANIECVLYGSITSYGNVTLKDRTVVNGNIFTHGTVTRINQPVINGYYRENMPVELFSIPTYTVTPGSVDKPITNNGTLVLAPGNYRDLTANSFSTLRLSAGVYQFRKFTTYSNVHIMLNAPSGEVIIRVAGEYSIGDQTHIESFSGNINPLNIQWYCHQSTQVSVGTDCRMIGVFTAPNYTFKLGARSILKGAIYAKSIILDPDAKVEKCNDTRYVDSDFDDVPDIVETAMGTNPVNGASKPEVAKPSSWYADASRDVVVHYDLSMFPKYFYHKDVPITIPAGVNNRAYNPIISIPEPDELGVPLALPIGNSLVAVYNIKAGIAPLTSLLLGFPLPGASIDLNFVNNDNYLLQHYNENTSAWETVPIAYVENNVVYANLASNGPFTISDVPVGLNTINNLSVCVDDDGVAVLEEKNYADPANDIIITNEQRLGKVTYSLDQFRTIMPQMRYSFVPTTATADLHLSWVENATVLSEEACLRFYDAPSGNYFANGWVEGLSFFHTQWDDAPDFNKVTPCPAVPAAPTSTAEEDNTIWFQPFNSHYTLQGTNFIAREEIYDEWNRNLRENIYRREFLALSGITNRITGNPLDPEADVFHPAGNPLAGANLTWVVKHELGHCLGLGSDNQQSRFIDPAVSGVDPTPGNACPTCECISRNLCRPMVDEWEGVICYEDGFPIRNQFFNDDIMREFDARDLVANTEFVVSYPYTRMFVRMQNRDGIRYNSNNWYDVRYRMFETPFTINVPANNTQRFFVMGLDSVMVSTVAGSNGVVGDLDGPGLSARLNKPRVLFINESNGDLYFGVSGKIKILSASGNVTTFAGTSTPGYANGPRLTAQFDADFCAPFCRDAVGNIYVCERNVNRIRKIDAAGNVTLFAGSATGIAGYADAAGSAALFSYPSSMCIDAANNLYVADYNNHVIRKIDPAGVVTTFTGTGVAGNVDGPIATAQFRTPCGIAIGPTGNLYVAERDNFDIRLIDMAAIPPTVSRFAGDGTTGYVDGPTLSARFGIASDLHVDKRGIVYVADAVNSAIRKIYQGGVSTIAGRPGDPVLYRDGCGTDARFNDPNDVAADTKGNIFVTEGLNHTIRKISTHIPLSVNAPALGARLEDINDAVWVEFTVTDAVSRDTLTITPDPLLLGSGAVPVPVPNTVGVDAQLFGPDNDYSLNETETNGANVAIVKTLPAGRYLLRIFAHNAAYANGAFSVRVANTRQIIAVPSAVGNSNTITGNLEREGDNDWFRINVAAAATVTIETTGRSAGLATAPVIYLYRDSEGLPVGGVPRVSTDAVHARIPIVRRVLRDGQSQISRIEFGAGFANDNRINEFGNYWVRVRSGSLAETGTYTLRITKN